MYRHNVGSIFDFPANAVKAVGRAIRRDGALGAVVNLAPAIALGVASGGLGAGLLMQKGGAEIARGAGVPHVLTTAVDPGGALIHATAGGAQHGFASGGLAGMLRGGAGGFASGMHDVSANPLLKATAAGLTFVLPPVGLALSGGLAATEQVAKRADAALHAADKLTSAFAHGNPQVKKAVAGVFARTAAAAKSGDDDAKRALVVLAAARKKLDAKRTQTFFVAPNGRITKGAFQLIPSSHALHGVGEQLGFYVRADGHVQRGAFRKVS